MHEYIFYIDFYVLFGGTIIFSSFLKKKLEEKKSDKGTKNMRK